jgi:ABC-2 type transport system permease protein
MTAFVQHFTFEFKTGLRNSTQLLMNYLFPLAFYAMMGLVMTQVNPLFTETMIPAMAVFVAMVSTLLGLPGPLVESRDAGIYRSFKINGVPAPSILSIPALSTIVHVLIVITLITVTAAPFFGGALPKNWGGFVLVTLVSILAFGAIGALIGVIATGARSTVLWAQMLFLPSMLLGGLMMPLSVLPASVRSVAGVLPATQAMQAYLGLAYGQETAIAPWSAVAILLAGGVLAFGLAIYLFNWDSRNDVRRGHPLLALLALAPYAVGAFLMH